MRALPLRLQKALPRLLTGVLITLIMAGHASGLLSLPGLASLELALYDSRLKLSAPGGIDPRIVILDIDEASLREREEGGEGRWPWPRNRLAELVNRSFDQYGVALLGFDVVFAERDETSGLATLNRLAQQELKSIPGYQAALASIEPQLDFDLVFAQAITGQPVVLGYTFLAPPAGQAPLKKGALPQAVLNTQALPLPASAVLQRPGYAANLDKLQKAASLAGHFNPAVDADGAVRRIPMLIEHAGGYYESLSLAMVRALSGGEPVEPVFGEGASPTTFGALEGLKTGGMTIPVDEELAALVPYRGPYRSFQYISAADVIAGRADPQQLEGKIALVGTSAPGLLDLRTTPMGQSYPGVEIHANMIAGILDGTIKEKPAFAIGADVLLVVILGLGLSLALPFMGPLGSTLLSLGLLASAVAFNLWSFSAAHLLLPLATLAVTLVVLYLFNMAYGFFFESRSKRLITGLFGQYVPPELVDEMAKDPANYSMEGESRELTILFSDVRGFTTISESLQPKDLAQLMNGFLSPFSQVIHEQRGTIDKYMGDCIMAFWGAPVQDAHHARHGVQAAFAMLKALEAINAEFKSKGWPAIAIGIGLNSGKVSVGNMGSSVRLAYTVMGDAVNLASRLEGITKEYGAKIVIGEATQAQIPDLVCRELDKVRVKGKDIAVSIYEPLGFAHDVDATTRLRVASFHQALAHYRDQQWEAAEQGFSELLAQDPKSGVLYQLYLSRIDMLRRHPPASPWDGAFTFQTK